MVLLFSTFLRLFAISLPLISYQSRPARATFLQECENHFTSQSSIAISVSRLLTFVVNSTPSYWLFLSFCRCDYLLLSEMLGYHSANASICRTDRSRQKQDFQDFQNPSIIPATFVPVPYGFDLPLSSAQISSKSIQDIEIQYYQNFYKDSCLSSNDVEFPNQDSKLLPSSVL